MKAEGSHTCLFSKEEFRENLKNVPTNYCTVKERDKSSKQNNAYTHGLQKLLGN
jgi:hypothetical protein